jgi:hypothetical protein
MLECPKCGAEADDEQKYCGQCGKPLESEGIGDVAAGAFRYEIKSAGWSFFLIGLNTPFLVVVWMLYDRVIPSGVVELLEPQQHAMIVIVGLAIYNAVLLYKKPWED